MSRSALRLVRVAAAAIICKGRRPTTHRQPLTTPTPRRVVVPLPLHTPSSPRRRPPPSQTRPKLVKKDGSAPSALEAKVVEEITNLEASNAALKQELKNLHINAAREVELDAGRKAILLFVPFPLLSDFRKIHKIFVEELEKKFNGTHVLIIANRTMISPASWARNPKFTGVRPRSRTLKAVQDGLLDDIVFPTEIVGKRIRVRTDGARLLKVHLNPKDQVAIESKVDTFRAVYRKLTNKDVSLEFA